MGICMASTSPSTGGDLLNYTEELRHMFVITVLINPARSRRAITVYNKFKNEIENVGARLVTVEYVCDGGPFSVTIPNYEPYHLQIKTDSFFFQKENLINMAAQQLPLDARYLVWCDYEVEFLNPNWAYDIIKGLKEHPIIQPFEDVSVLDQMNNEMYTEKSFAYYMAAIQKNEQNPENKEVLPIFEVMSEASGYVWAMNKDLFDDLGGLLECCVLGNGDRVMAYCLAQKANELAVHKASDAFMGEINSWQKKVKSIAHKIGFLPGKINLGCSGVSRDKQLIERWAILEKFNFEPRRDLKKNSDGVLYLCNEKKPGLAQELRRLVEDVNQEMYSDQMKSARD